MELVLRRDTLAEAVAWSSRSISPRPAVAVLSGVRIEAREDGVEFSSYDYEVSSRVTVAAEDVTEPGVESTWSVRIVTNWSYTCTACRSKDLPRTASPGPML